MAPLAFLAPLSSNFFGNNSNIADIRKCARTTPARITPTAIKRDGALPGRPDAKKYNVTFRNPKDGTVATYQVPEDRYIWYAMNEQGAELPSSCRNGCCTTCAAKITNGEVDQMEALGLLREMREKGYALLCVSYPKSDIDCTLQDEDEVYIQQFGSSFESGGVEWGGVLPEEE